MATFVKELRGSAEPAAFEFIAAVFCFDGDAEARDFAINGMAFPSYFENVSGKDDAPSGDVDSESHRPRPLLKAFSTFKKALTAAPATRPPKGPGAHIPVVQPPASMRGDEINTKIYEQVMSKRKEMQKF